MRFGRHIILKLTVLICAVCFSALSAQGQDILWSQPQSMPVFLNPATVGLAADYRASAHYKSSWASIAAPYRTVAASFDMRLTGQPVGATPRQDQVFKGLGVGLTFLNDRTGDPELKTNIATAHVAYTVKINKSSGFGGGLSIGFDQRSVDPAGGRWGSQFNGHAYDPGLPSGEAFGGEAESHLELGGGVAYTYLSTPARGETLPTVLHLGLAGQHLGRVSVSKAEFITKDMPARFSLIAESELPISKSSALAPAAYGQIQGGEMNIMVGSSFKQLLVYGDTFIRSITQSSMSAGVYYRVNQAVIVQGQLVYGNFRVGISYDMDISDLKTYSERKGGFELSLGWRNMKSRR